MAKKPRSQRRKKGKASDGDGGDDGASMSKMETLSDTYTVDDSVGMSLFEDDYMFGGKPVSQLNEDSGLRKVW